jgi:hypothetical protein
MPDAEANPLAGRASKKIISKPIRRVRMLPYMLRMTLFVDGNVN